MNKSIKKISFNDKKKVYYITKQNKSILKNNNISQTTTKNIKSKTKKTTLPYDRINNKSIKNKKNIKNNKSKVKTKKFTSYRKKKSKHFKSTKKNNIKKYLIKTKIINENTKSPDKLVDDLFQICYKDKIKVTKYPKYKYNK